MTFVLLGGSPDLHQESCLAVHRSRKTPELSRILRLKGETLRVTDYTFTFFYDEGPDVRPGRGTLPEVDRTRLLSLLLESIQQDTIKWRREIKEAKQTGEP